MTTANKSEHVNRKAGLMSHFMPSTGRIGNQDRCGRALSSFLPSSVTRIEVEINKWAK